MKTDYADAKIKKILRLEDLEEEDIIILRGINSRDGKAAYLGEHPLMPNRLRFVYKNLGGLFDDTDFDSVCLDGANLKVKDGDVVNDYPNPIIISFIPKTDEERELLRRLESAK